MEQIGGTRLVPDGVEVLNPAFDVTPHRYVSAIVTERGVARAPFRESLGRMVAESRREREAAEAAEDGAR